MELVPLLRKLSEATGVSGYEHPIRDLVAEEFGRYATSIRSDTLGNLIALVPGSGPEPRPSIMLAGHMDEIGLIVSHIEEGFLHVPGMHSYDERVLPGQEVIVHGWRELHGVIGARPPHVLAPGESEKPYPTDKLLVDTGLPPDEVSQLVRVGDLITMNAPLVELKGGLVAGKALDDRAAVAAVAVCLEELSRSQHEWDVYAVATVQEEEGCKGALTSAFGLAPDIGIAIDVTWAHQPGAPDEYTYPLGEGPTISCGPNFHPGLVKALRDTADSLEMDVHLEPAARPGGTDAWAIQIAREGIPAGLLSIPQRNMHTPVEVCSVKDIERVGRLLAAFIRALDGKSLDKLTFDLGLDETE
ncbi:MAG TPA: M20/M25/M40 family metallo-hydrolase [Anaerolineae bacterium]|nr:M20/M25/M40 family metallo-hydrolase [Anaerolineae bacterium]